MIARRPMLTTVVSLCSLAGAMLAAAPVALAVTPPVVEEESVLNVASTSATLQAKIDPEGSETTYRFEYGTSEAYGSKIPIPDGPAGSGWTPVVLVAHPQDLVPGTVYHFRVVLEGAGGTPVDGPDRMFTTQAVGVPFSLPDGREWELVSPAQKNGAQIVPLFNHSVQAAEDGGGMAYYASAPFAGESSPSNVEASEALSRRGADEWTTQDIAVPHEKVTLAGNLGPEYRLFSPDLSRAAIEPWGYSPLSSEASERTVYIRDNAAGLYTPMVTPANTAPGAKFDGEGHIAEKVYFITATPNMTRVVIQSYEPLTSESGGENHKYYYEWVEGKLKLINVYPPNVPGTIVKGGGNSYIGQRNANIRHAISDDGSRIFWSNDGGLFMRDVPAGESRWISAAQGVTQPEEVGVTFQYASSDGSRAFFSDHDQLTTAPGGGLYVYEAGTGKLTLITAPLNAGEQAEVLGFVPGASEDGSYVYVVAQGVLSANENANREKAVSGANNLYVLHGEAAAGGGTRWSASFIAALSNEDRPSWEGAYSGFFVNMSKLVSRASPDGRYFAFMSDRSLTGYDNRDARSGQPDEEVYEYDAASGRLVCVSCDPTGARPEGRQEPEGTKVDPWEVWRGRWIAGSVPGWLEESNWFEPANYQPRYLSDSGRLFFDSPAGLAPQDVNGTEDVYQYEPAGAGSCAEAQGCVSLISGGTGPGESVFQDASATGEDAFFVTGDRLVGEDFDNGYDMYDAHACRAQAPCFPAGSALSPPCNSGDSCKVAPSPQPLLFGSPASATFSGAGNLTPGPAAASSKRGLTRAQRSARALRACQRMHRRSRRMACERGAEKRYGKQAGRRPRVSRVRVNTSARTGR